MFFLTLIFVVPTFGITSFGVVSLERALYFLHQNGKLLVKSYRMIFVNTKLHIYLERTQNLKAEKQVFQVSERR